MAVPPHPIRTSLLSRMMKQIFFLQETPSTPEEPPPVDPPPAEPPPVDPPPVDPPPVEPPPVDPPPAEPPPVDPPPVDPPPVEPPPVDPPPVEPPPVEPPPEEPPPVEPPPVEPPPVDPPPVEPPPVEPPPVEPPPVEPPPAEPPPVDPPPVEPPPVEPPPVEPPPVEPPPAEPPPVDPPPVEPPPVEPPPVEPPPVHPPPVEPPPVGPPPEKPPPVEPPPVEPPPVKPPPVEPPPVEPPPVEPPPVEPPPVQPPPGKPPPVEPPPSTPDEPPPSPPEKPPPSTPDEPPPSPPVKPPPSPPEKPPSPPAEPPPSTPDDPPPSPPVDPLSPPVEPPPPPSPLIEPPPLPPPSTPGGSPPLPPLEAPPPPNSTPPSKSNAISTTATVAIAVSCGAVLLLLLTFFTIYMFTKRKRRKTPTPPNQSSTTLSTPTYANPISPIFRDRGGSRRISPTPVESIVPLPTYYQLSQDPPPETSITHFKYNELSDITNGFARECVIGEGGFGSVYKATLPNGHDVAIKQLKLNSGQGEREFRTEVETISRVHHRRLVSLVGYCIEGQERLLVYDFVSNNTLDFHLHRRSADDQGLDWNTRLKVAIGAAHGIAYLHEDCTPSIIHRDIKSANILLDHNFEAQVADFGLAKYSMEAQTHVSTGVKGTFGYLAPEYASSGNLTVKSDVFSFGVVLLELITGRKPITGLVGLVEWAQPLMSIALETGDMGELIDPKLGENYDKNTMQIMLVVASACVRHTASMRPRMRTVVSVLENHGILDIQNGVIPGQGTFSNVSGYSEQIEVFNRMLRGEDFESSVTTSEFTDTSLSSVQPFL